MKPVMHANKEQLIDFLKKGNWAEKVEQTYTIRVSSRFVLTQTQIKQALGIGYQITSIELEKDYERKPITVDTAAMAIINAGYRALARAYHPDRGGDIETFKLINQTKKELTELLESLK